MEHDVPFDPSLDLSEPRAPVSAPLRPRTPALAAAGRILVIDDEPSFVSGLTQLLRRDGYTVDTAANGTAALTQLQAQCYDVLLCDLRMPDLDGPALYARLLHQYTPLSASDFSHGGYAQRRQYRVPRTVRPAMAAQAV